MKQNKIQKCFNNKIIVIIGATGGLGKAILKECQKYTNTIVMVGRDVEKLKIVSKELNVEHFFQMDISNQDQIRTVLDEIENKIGSIDISFNFGGFDVFNTISELSGQDLINTCRTNFEGPMFYTQHLLKKYIKRKKGIIANVNAFSNGLVPFPYYSIDSASRAGIANFFRALRRELNTDYPEIRFISFSPPITDTPTERSRISSKVWELEKMKFHNPEKVAKNVIKKIASNHNEIMNLDEKALQVAEILSSKLSNFVFFNKFKTLSAKVLSE